MPLCITGAALAAAPGTCTQATDDACYVAFELVGAGGRLNDYSSRRPNDAADVPGPTRALIALHGHSRDANKTFDAALLAVRRGGQEADTLVVAPVFQQRRTGPRAVRRGRGPLPRR